MAPPEETPTSNLLKSAFKYHIQGAITDVQDAIKRHANPALEKALVLLTNAIALTTPPRLG